MKWMLVSSAVLVGLVLMVTVVGALLPRGHVASRTARLGPPAAAIWDAITDPAAMTSWRPEVQRVEILPDRDGRRMWREIGRHGRITFEAMEAEPPRRLVTRIADPDLPFGGSWTYEIRAAHGGGSVVVITEDGEVRSPIFRFVSRFVFGHTATLDGYLRALGKKFGEDVTPGPA